MSKVFMNKISKRMLHFIISIKMSEGEILLKKWPMANKVQMMNFNLIFKINPEALLKFKQYLKKLKTFQTSVEVMKSRQQ